MGMKTHYLNKFPGGSVQESETSLDVYDAKGQHQVAMRKNGAGQWLCVSEAHGLDSRHCLAPIPKDARVHKRNAAGHISKSEEHEERVKRSAHIAKDGRVPSIDELKKEGWTFNDDGSVRSMPKKQLAKPAPAKEPEAPAGDEGDDEGRGQESAF